MNIVATIIIHNYFLINSFSTLILNILNLIYYEDFVFESKFLDLVSDFDFIIFRVLNYFIGLMDKINLHYYCQLEVLTSQLRV